AAPGLAGELSIGGQPNVAADEHLFSVELESGAILAAGAGDVEALAIIVGSALKTDEPSVLPGLSAAVAVLIAHHQDPHTNVGLGRQGNRAVGAVLEGHLVSAGRLVIDRDREDALLLAVGQRGIDQDESEKDSQQIWKAESLQHGWPSWPGAKRTARTPPGGAVE